MCKNWMSVGRVDNEEDRLNDALVACGQSLKLVQLCAGKAAYKVEWRTLN